MSGQPFLTPTPEKTPVDPRFVDQTIFLDGHGNCLSACVATILGRKIEDVPNFADCGYFEGLKTWLTGEGLSLISIRFEEGHVLSSNYFGHDERWFVAWGFSKRVANGRPKQHAVVAKADGYGCMLVHDPHPSRAGLAGEPFGVLWIVRDVCTN